MKREQDRMLTRPDDRKRGDARKPWSEPSAPSLPSNRHAIGSPERAEDLTGPPRINGLWIGGRLSTLERLSLLSHLRHGHEYHLWTYENMDVPAGVILEDANQICDQSSIFSYQVGRGKGSVSAFSNLFRYRLLKEQGGWWCDTDVVALKRFDFEQEYVFASQLDRDGTSLPTTCVIKAPRDSALMNECYARAMAVDRATLSWGSIGPKLLSELVARFGLDEFVTPPATFCPTNWFEAEIDPALHTWALTDDSYAVHLWHEMWRRGGADKNGEHPGTLYEALKAPYSRDLTGGHWLRRWLDWLRRRPQAAPQPWTRPAQNTEQRLVI